MATMPLVQSVCLACNAEASVSSAVSASKHSLYVRAPVAGWDSVRRVGNARHRPSRERFRLTAVVNDFWPFLGRTSRGVLVENGDVAKKRVRCGMAFWPLVRSADRGEVGETKPLSDFMRFCDNGENGVELQTAVVSYRRPFPFSLLQPNLQVDLVAAVHIADKEYFTALQKKLAAYDRVLYEMVADKNPRQTNRNAKTRWRPPRRSPGHCGNNFNIIAFIQKLMSQVLRLDFQLECMNYQRENWYHADLDYATFQKLQFERGENAFKALFNLVVTSGKGNAESTPAASNLDPWRARLLWVARVLPMPLVCLFVIEGVCAHPSSPLRGSPEMKALLNLNISAALKVFLAKQMTSITIDSTALVEDSVIIGERNRAAMKELKGALADGCRTIAIFYGAAHMPNMDDCLQEQFGIVPTETQWQTAWSIKDRKVTHQGWLGTFLNSLAESSGWPVNQYEAFAILLISWVLAFDLWCWEFCFNVANEYAHHVVISVVQLLEKAWRLA